MDRDLTDEFQILIKTIIAPMMKEFGFKKSNLNFNKTLDDLVQYVNVQRSQWNHVDRISFTLNLGFYNSRLYLISQNKIEQPKFIREYNCFAWIRTGKLIYNHDYWYELNQDTKYEDIAEKIEKDMKGYVIPMFQELNTLNSLIELFRTDFTDRKFPLIADIDNVAVLELEFGDFERGKEIITNMYKKATIPQSVKSTRVYPDGREEVKWSEPTVNEFSIEKYNRMAKMYKIAL
jgi:hypothetical protein